MGVRQLGVVLFAGMFFLLVCPMIVSAEQPNWWGSAWSFRQEIIIPFNTKVNSSANQPVDTTVVFSDPCWAVNETQSSVRVICQWEYYDVELESQVYDFVHSDNEHIACCNLVFLIPSEADGTERYFIYYDEARTVSPGYPDHVSIDESSYFYEPIPGYSVQSRFYEIIQNGSIIYTISQDGTYLWYTTTHFVTKLTQGVKEMSLKAAETAASFEFAFYYGNEMWQYNSTSQKLISKEILSNGNLMVSCRIISQSNAGDLQTIAVYKYFYCPTSATRVYAHVIHEALKECMVYPQTNTVGTYAAMQCGGMKSQSLAELNFGKLYPFIHVYTEQNTFEEYRLDVNPEYNQKDPVIRLLQNTDDVDLGVKAWTSFDDGLTGAVHALVFGSSSVVKAGVGERDGIQVKAYESDYPHLPGLVYRIAGFQFTRNTYERNASGKNTVIPKGFTAEFDAEFFSSPHGGYPLVEQEAEVFQALATILPKSGVGISPELNQSSDKFELTVYIHGAPSVPLGFALSVLTGRSFPYMSVEVCRDDTVIYSGTAGRVPLRPISSTDETSLRERVAAAVHMFDLRNVSLWKKISFHRLEPGRYIVKVFRGNPLVGDERRFIGYAVVDLTQNRRVHVWCRPQGSCRVSMVDQQGSGVSGAQVQLIYDGMILSQNTTDGMGSVVLTAPCSFMDRYMLRVLYQGFEVKNESFFLRFGRAVVPMKISLELDQYEWTVRLVDLWGLPPGVDIRPHLTSKEMDIPTVFFGVQRGNDTFLFTNLVPAQYILEVSYKSFLVEQEFRIPTEEKSVVFPAEFPVSFRVLDSHGVSLDGVFIRLSRGGKTVDTLYNGSGSVISVPPGLYRVSVIHAGTVIGQRSLDVVGARSIDLITTHEPIFPLVVLLIGIVLILCGLCWSVIRKDLVYVLVFLVVSVAIVSLVCPWWSLQGVSSGIQTSSALYLVPLDLVSMTSTSQVVVGELSFFPDVFVTVMAIVVGMMVLGWCCLGGGLVVKRFIKKRWFMILLGGVLVLLIGALVLFSLAMSAFTEVGVGSFLGNGTVDVSVQGQDSVVPVMCQWGPGIGFWLYGLCIFILLFTLVYVIINNKKR